MNVALLWYAWDALAVAWCVLTVRAIVSSRKDNAWWDTWMDFATEARRTDRGMDALDRAVRRISFMTWASDHESRRGYLSDLVRALRPYRDPSVRYADFLYAQGKHGHEVASALDMLP